MTPNSPYLTLLKDRINLRQIPFSERGARLLVFCTDDHFAVRLTERWYKQNRGAVCLSPPPTYPGGALLHR